MCSESFNNNQLILFEGPNRRSRASFFLIMGLIGLLAVITGFAKTFIIPVTAGSFEAPFAIYLHGTFAFSWIILFMTQTFLIHFKKLSHPYDTWYLGCFHCNGYGNNNSSCSNLCGRKGIEIRTRTNSNLWSTGNLYNCCYLSYTCYNRNHQ